jgi:nucleolar complex protein 2
VSSIVSTSPPKPSTLRPLALDVLIRAPQQYLKTRVYAEGLVEDASLLLAEWLASGVVLGSIAFPEIIVPVVVQLRKAIKGAKRMPSSKGSSGTEKEVRVLKTLVERIEDSARWVEQKRKTVSFAPGKVAQVEEWEAGMKESIDESPLGKYVKILQKLKEKRQRLLAKVCQGITRLVPSL